MDIVCKYVLSYRAACSHGGLEHCKKFDKKIQIVAPWPCPHARAGTRPVHGQLEAIPALGCRTLHPHLCIASTVGWNPLGTTNGVHT